MQKQEKKTRNRPGRPAMGQSLTPQDVAQAALELIDSEGLNAFSMRRLGQSLGVEAMALYNHFADKEAILNAVASLTLERVPVPLAKGSWRNRIKDLCFSVRSIGLRHPNLFPLAMTRRTAPASALRLVEGALAALADAGLSLEAQSNAYHTCFQYVRGFCLWEIEELGLKHDRKPADLAAVPSAYPRTAAATKLIFTPDLDRQFEAGLQLILRGIQAQGLGRKDESRKKLKRSPETSK